MWVTEDGKAVFRTSTPSGVVIDAGRLTSGRSRRSLTELGAICRSGCVYLSPPGVNAPRSSKRTQLAHPSARPTGPAALAPPGPDPHQLEWSATGVTPISAMTASATKISAP